MKSFLLSYSILCGDKIRTLTSIIQIMLFIISMVFSLSAYYTSRQYIDLVYRINDKELYYICDNSWESKKIQDNNIQTSFSSSAELEISNDLKYMCIMYDDELFNIVMPTIKTGKSPDQQNECVLSFDLAREYRVKCGENIKIEMNNGDYVILKVTGIADRNAKVLSDSVTGSELTLKAVYSDFKQSIIVSKPLKTHNNTLSFIKGRCGIAHIKNEEYVKDKYPEIAEFSFTNMLKDEISEDYEIIAFFFLFSSISFVIGFIGIYVNNYLSLFSNAYMFSIYYICGMSLKMCFKIIFFRNTILLFFSSVFSLVTITVFDKTNIINGIIISRLAIIYATIISILAAIISSIPIYKRIKRIQPIELLKGALD